MPSLRDIRRRIGSVKSTAKITSAMKMVAAAKLRKAQNAIISARPYFQKMEYVLSKIINASGADFYNPLIEKRAEIKNIAMIVIASDKGFCGAFNMNIVKAAIQHTESVLWELHPHAKFTVISVGKRASNFFDKYHYNVKEKFNDIFNDLDYSNADDICDLAMNGFLKGEFDEVYVVYGEFKSLLRQLPKVEKLLPFEPVKDDSQVQENLNYIFEPTSVSILNDMLPNQIKAKVWKTLLETNAAQQAARMMAMDTATTNANDLIKQLELSYNKARQSSITTEMLEIVSGANALNGQ